MRSNCPLNFGIELFGDKWTLLIIRDMVFHRKRSYNEFMASAEGIATSTLGDRLAMLEREGFITKNQDGSHKQKYIYSLTEKAIDLVPIIIEIGLWADKYGGDQLNEQKDLILGDVKVNKVMGLERLKARLRAEHLV